MAENGSAINVNSTAEIPKDYMDVMAVPVSYLEKHQSSILGLSKDMSRQASSSTIAFSYGE